MNWEKLLKKQYQVDTFIKDTRDESLLEEAITKCETVFTLIDREELLKNRGALALCYLALKQEQRKRSEELEQTSKANKSDNKNRSKEHKNEEVISKPKL